MFKPEELRFRTKKFAIEAIRLIRHYPRDMEGSIIGRQLLRSATSVAANYRAVCRARSKKEFIAKIGLVVEEIDESVFWLELTREVDLIQAAKLENITREANQLLAIFAASQRTAKQNNKMY